MRLKNPPLWLWDMIGLGYLILGILGIYKYGISRKYVSYIGHIIIGVGFLVLAF